MKCVLLACNDGIDESPVLSRGPELTLPQQRAMDDVISDVCEDVVLASSALGVFQRNWSQAANFVPWKIE